MLKLIAIMAVSMRSLRNHLWRSLAIAIPLGLVIATVAAVSFFLDGVEHDAMIAARHFPDVLVQQQVGGRTESLFYLRYRRVIMRHPAVEYCYPRVWGYVNFRDQKDVSRTFVAMGLEPSAMGRDRVVEPSIERGRSLLQSDEKAPEPVGVIGKALARSMQCDVGDFLVVDAPGGAVKIKVIGVFSSPVQIYTADMLLTTRATARRIFGFKFFDEVSDIAVFLKNPEMADDVASVLRRTLDGAYPLTRSVMEMLTEKSFGQKSGFFYLLWLVLLANVVLIAWSMMSQISFSLQREIGILKAIGWDTGDIILLKCTETLILGLGAVTGGLAIAIWYVLAGAPGLKHLLIGWADIYPDYPIPLRVEPATLILLFLLGIFPLLIGTVVPIWRMGIVEPDRILKS